MHANPNSCPTLLLNSTQHRQRARMKERQQKYKSEYPPPHTPPPHPFYPPTLLLNSTQCRRRACRKADRLSITISTPSVAQKNTKKAAGRGGEGGGVVRRRKGREAGRHTGIAKGRGML